MFEGWSHGHRVVTDPTSRGGIMRPSPTNERSRLLRPPERHGTTPPSIDSARVRVRPRVGPGGRWAASLVRVSPCGNRKRPLPRWGVTSKTELELLQSFATTLDVVGASHSMSDSHAGARWDREGSIEGVPVVLEVRAVPSLGDVLAIERRPGDAYKVVVARRISASVAEASRGARHRLLRRTRSAPPLATAAADRHDRRGAR